MSTDLLERLEQPEYTGENRCGACTAVNLLIAVALAALLGRRNRALGLLAFLGSAALVYLRGYLVPGTPELTKKYLPQPVLALFGKDARPAPLDDALARRAADRAGEEAAVPVEVHDAGAGADGTGDGEGETDEKSTDWDADADPDADVSREAVEDLLARPMDEVLEAFAVVEDDEDAADLVLVDSFREAWEETIGELSDDPAARRATFAEVVEASVADVEIERRDDDRFYALVDGDAVHNWITEAAVLSDMAAHRALEDPRWDVLEPAERLSVLRGFRVFLTTCPECGGPVSATDDVVESCCGAWDVVAVECGDCGARVLELEAPEDAGDGPEPDPADPNAGGFTR